MATEDFKLPFPEQIAAIRARTGNLIPTERWTDVMRNGHDRGFAVAGAMKADLLKDFADTIDTAVAEGKSLDWFRGQFDEITNRHGWAYRGERNWRTRVIYGTNMRTSYAAGRLAQLRDPELQQVAPYWMYRHGGSADPRPQHLEWDSQVLPAGDGWWRRHYPPNGWGCSCYVIAVSEAQARRMGGRFAQPGPDPRGAIDAGWDYMPGADVADELRAFVQDKANRLPAELASAMVRDAAPVNVRDFAARAAEVSDRKITMDIGPVRQAERIKARTGFDLDGFIHQIDNYSVRHILKHHSDASREAARGQLAVTLEDFGLLPLTADFFDDVRHDGKNRTGRDVLVFTKVINGIGYRYVAEIRNGKALVAADSLRKKRGAWES